MADLAAQLRYPSTGEQIRLRLNSMRNSEEYAVYVAQLPGGQVAGWIGLRVFRSVEQDGCAEISGLIIDQQVRSCGIGRILLDAADAWARDQGCHAISVHSNVIRERAHQFYARNGYNHVKTQKYLVKHL
jgi:GNAT superfamily N-acetyltransferase